MTITEENLGFAVAELDEDGRLIRYATRSGEWVSLVQPREKAKGTAIDPRLYLQRTDYMQVLVYGQSLHRGATTGPDPITTTQPYHNVMLKSGVLARPPFAVDYSAFVPLAERYLEPTQNEAETPTSSMLNRMVELLLKPGETSSDIRFVGGAPGHGGRRIDQLNRGTVLWDQMLDQITAAKAIANAEGRSCSVWALAWGQGENDYALNPYTGVDWTTLEYYTLFRQLVGDFAEDAADITGQLFQPVTVCYQTAAHRRFSRDHNSIAIAQWRVARDDPRVTLACPMYAIPTNWDNLHLTGDSSIQLGRYEARALARTAQHQVAWKPLWPTLILWQGRVIDITFNVPDGALVFDTTLVSAASNMGFDVWSNGVPVTGAIQSVEIVGRDRVRIRLQNDMPLGSTLTYARGRPGDPETAGPASGPRGNLRDTEGDSDNYVDSSGARRYMHNWCVAFEYSYGDVAL